MYKNLLLFLLSLHFGILYSQTLTQTIRGQVTDVQSKITLPGANVVVIDSARMFGAATDANGNFRIENVPVGRHRIRISFVGYKEVIIPVILNSAKELVLNIELEESVIMGKEVEITAVQDKSRTNNEMTVVSARSFTIEETQRFAGTWSDPARMVASYAGVVGANDTRNDITIRGNSPSGVLWRLEGVDIFNPNHFAAFGTTGGPVSILNNNTLANSDFMSGAFPAEYGNALSGVFDLKMRNGNNEKREWTGQAGLNGFEFGAEGPFSKKKGSSYLISYRYSTLEFFDMLGIHFGTSAIPHYQDASIKLNFPSSKWGTISLFGIGGLSSISVLESEKDTSDWSFGLSGYDLRFTTNMGAAGITHSYIINSKTYTRLTVAVSGNGMKSSTDSVNLQKETIPTYRNNSTQGELVVNFFVNKKFSARNNIKAGVNTQKLFYSYHDSTLSWKTHTYVSLRDFKGDSYLIQPYAQWKFKITDRFILNSGIHYQQFTLNDTWSLEPRAGLTWQFLPAQSLSLAYGRHSQLQMGDVYFFQVETAPGNYSRINKNSGLSKSDHFVLAYDNNLNENTRIKTEVYYQSVHNTLVDGNAVNSFSMMNIGADYNISFPDTLVNKGKGTNYGLELTFERFFHKGYYFLVTGSLFKSTYQGSDEKNRSTAFDGRYAFNALGGSEYKMGKKERVSKTITIDGKVTVVGGKRYTPIDENESKARGYTWYIDEEAFSRKYKDYFRADLKIGFRRGGKKAAQVWALDVQNILNTKNILVESYDKSTNTLRAEYQLGLFPVFLYKIEF